MLTEEQRNEWWDIVNLLDEHMPRVQGAARGFDDDARDLLDLADQTCRLTQRENAALLSLVGEWVRSRVRIIEEDRERDAWVESWGEEA